MATVNTYIHGSRRFQVTASAVVADLMDGGQQHVYKNGILPVGTSLSCIQHLAGIGAIKEIK